MYVPPSNAEERPQVMLDYMEAHPLAALVTSGSEGLFATHLPLLVDRTRGPFGTLQGHLARANRHHQLARDGDEALVIFSGHDAYITPTFYPSKARDGRVVPTWNYVAVHAYGTLRFDSDPARLRGHLEALTTHHESGRPQPWSVSDTPEGYVDRLLGAIVGVEVEITRLEGKWKMSQNRSSDDIDGVIAGLQTSGDPRAREVADIVRERRPDAPP